MNQTLKRYLISSITTFLAAFLGVLALQLKAGLPIDLTVIGVFSLISVAARAGVKAVIEWLATANLGSSQG